MTPLYIAATAMTPEVDFRPADHSLALSGESYPENVITFYAPIVEALRHYLQEYPSAGLNVSITITYYNSASAKAFHRIMSLLNDACEAGGKIVVDWCYDAEDEMMCELGNDLKEEYAAIAFKLCSADVNEAKGASRLE